MKKTTHQLNDGNAGGFKGVKPEWDVGLAGEVVARVQQVLGGEKLKAASAVDSAVRVGQGDHSTLILKGENIFLL